MSASTITRHINHLEHAIGVKLFHRRQSGYVLTDGGQNLLPIAERLAADADFFERQALPLVSDSVPHVSLELPEVLAAYIIVPALTKIGAMDNDIHLDVSNGAESTRLAVRPSDIVVRLKRPDYGDYSARKIGVLHRAIYCSKSYLERKGLTEANADLSKLDYVGWTDRMGYLPTATWLQEVTNGKPLCFRGNNVRIQTDAVVAGLGAGALPRFVGEAHDLVRIEFDGGIDESNIWLLRNEETDTLEHVSRVVDWIAQIIKNEKDVLVF